MVTGSYIVANIIKCVSRHGGSGHTCHLSPVNPLAYSSSTGRPSGPGTLVIQGSRFPVRATTVLSLYITTSNGSSIDDNVYCILITVVVLAMIS